jgi:hypothetical protein
MRPGVRDLCPPTFAWWSRLNPEVAACLRTRLPLRPDLQRELLAFRALAVPGQDVGDGLT